MQVWSDNVDGYIQRIYPSDSINIHNLYGHGGLLYTECNGARTEGRRADRPTAPYKCACQWIETMGSESFIVSWERSRTTGFNGLVDYNKNNGEL